MNLALHLQLAGLFQILLALAHFGFPRRFGWREELAKVSLFTRQVFWVHQGFIMLTVTLFGLLSMGWTASLLERGSLSRAVLAGLFLFWAIRWVCQIFVYDRRLWRGHRFNTVIHFLALLLWSYLLGIYGWALARQFPTL